MGSVARGNFGWAIRDLPDPLQEIPSDASIEAFEQAVSARIAEGRSVALGFECPLFVPVRSEPILLTAARAGEGNRSWSAGAGTGSLAVGLVQTVWILKQIHSRVTHPPKITFSWKEFSSGPGHLLLWEAFVTRAAKVGSHHDDAGAAVEAFCNALPDPTTLNAIEEPEVFSLIGAAAIRAGWDVATAALSSPCLVLAA